MAQNAISEELNSKISWGGMPPDPTQHELPSAAELPLATVGSYTAI